MGKCGKLLRENLLAICVAIAGAILCASSIGIGVIVQSVQKSRASAVKMGTELNAVNGTYSYFNNYYIYRVGNNTGKALGTSAQSLFTSAGVNQSVLDEILGILGDIGGRTTPDNYGSTYHEKNGNHMSEWVMDFFNVPQNERVTDTEFAGPNATAGRVKSGGVYVKLFDSAGLAGVDLDIADKWFQIVYVSGDEHPIVTFWMEDGYKGEKYINNANGTVNNGYATSTVRDALMSDFDAFKGNFAQLSARVRVPSVLAGEWQSTVFQSQSQGPLGRVNLSSNLFSIMNDMDSVYLESTNFAYMDDGWWLPSYFEAVHMGTAKEAHNQYGAEVMEQNGNGANAQETQTITNGGFGRTGLWKISAYERFFSGIIGIASGYHARSLYVNGGLYAGTLNHGDDYGAWGYQINPVRPALHLDLGDITNADPCAGNNHDYGAWQIITPATTTAVGQKQRVCSRNSQHVEDETIPMLPPAPDTCPNGHDWGQWMTVTAPTQNHTGLEERICSRDENHIDARSIPMLPQTGEPSPCADEHDWGEWTTITEATDEHQGLERRICKNDPHHHEDRVTSILPTDPNDPCHLAHDWGEWTLVKPSTEKVMGMERRICKNNPSHVETRFIALLTPTDNPETANKLTPIQISITIGGGFLLLGLIAAAVIWLVLRKRQAGVTPAPQENE